MTIDPKKMAKIAQAYAAAWSSGDPTAVASFYATDGQICINRGDVLKGNEAIVEMAAGFYAEFPDLIVNLDSFRLSGSHGVFNWTLEGNHSETGNFVKVPGWEEWELDENMKVVSSLGWFDADEYDRQVAGSA